MGYEIKELKPADLLKYNESFYITLSALKESPILSIKDSITLLQIVEKQEGHIFVAIEKPYGVVGTSKLLIEQKFTNGGEKAGHIEDVATRIGFQGKGIQKSLINKVFEVSKLNNCYKLTLDCKPELRTFYEKMGFEDSGKFMRMYLK